MGWNQQGSKHIMKGAGGEAANGPPLPPPNNINESPGRGNVADGNSVHGTVEYITVVSGTPSPDSQGLESGPGDNKVSLASL